MKQRRTSQNDTQLILPEVGTIKNLVRDKQGAQKLRQESVNLQAWDLTERQVLDIELLLNGGLVPYCLAGRLEDTVYGDSKIVLTRG